MKLVRALLALLFIASSMSVSSTAIVWADNEVQFVPSSTDVNQIGGCEGSAASSPVCQDIRSNTNPLFGPSGILTTVAGLFGLITGVISVFMVIIGGLRYITSGGDPGKTASAKNTILYAAIGLAVATVSGTIVRFLLSRL